MFCCNPLCELYQEFRKHNVAWPQLVEDTAAARAAQLQQSGQVYFVCLFGSQIVRRRMVGAWRGHIMRCRRDRRGTVTAVCMGTIRTDGPCQGDLHGHCKGDLYGHCQGNLYGHCQGGRHGQHQSDWHGYCRHGCHQEDGRGSGQMDGIVEF